MRPPCRPPAATALAALVAPAVLAVSLSGCGLIGSAPRRGGVLPPAVASYTLGPGDRFELVIVGEEKLPKEFTLAPDGTVDLPWIGRQKLDGLEPQQVSALVAGELVKQEYLREPSVVVNVKAFGSKRVLIGGQINKPGDIPYSPGLSLYQLITNAGGFTQSANRNNVLVTRKLKGGGTKTVSFSVDAISEGRSPDVPLQAGDSVYVDERSF
ncbi:MAG: polysaccharide export protein [Polyangiaceae bacterium]|nr:polysaccharide export protein [Polyangiaceae bacterium]